MGEIVRKGHFAASIGVQRQRITALVKRGLPVRSDGRIDVEQALEWMRANVSQQARFEDRGIHKILAETAKPQRAAKDGRKAPAAPTPAEASPAPADEPALDDEAVPLPYAAAKAMRETYLGRKAKLEYLKESGKLLPADVVESRWSRIFVSVRNRILSCPGRIASKIPHLAQVEIAVIEKELHAALELGEAPHAH